MVAFVSPASQGFSQKTHWGNYMPVFQQSQARIW